MLVTALALVNMASDTIGSVVTSFLPTTSPIRDDETRRVDGSVHSVVTVNRTKTAVFC